MNKINPPKLDKKKPFNILNWLTIKSIRNGALLVFILSTLVFRLKFHINIIISIILAIIILILILLYIIRIFNKKKEKVGQFENWHDLYGEKITNIAYFKDNKIINTFKKNGDNYKEEIGEINNGKDYEKNERNYYDLFLPYSSLKRKNKFNGIMLFIHGGGWIHGKKKDCDFICSRYAKYGYITATMNYTLLDKKYKDHNIFKIIDEITACIESIKEKLKNEGFDENKLELALGGMSAGAHLSLLYGYSIKKSPIPIKFVINIVGPISLEPKFYGLINKGEEPFDNIEPESINNGIKEKKIVKLEDETTLLKLMNAFTGNKYDKHINEMLENKKIKTDNEHYKEMLKFCENAFLIKYINSNTVPTLCEYGGKDSIVGVSQYSYLKQYSMKYGNKIELVYLKEAEHHLVDETEEGMNSAREMHYQILHFAKTYFTLDKKD